jgi:hypothetical protein
MQHREFKLPVYPVVINLTGRQRQDTYKVAMTLGAEPLLINDASSPKVTSLT